MSLAGVVVGWRIHAGLLDVLAAYGLMIAFSFAIIWVGVLLGSAVATPEGVQGVAFVAIFPVTLVASTFVPTSTLPWCCGRSPSGTRSPRWPARCAISSATRAACRRPTGRGRSRTPSPTRCSGRVGIVGVCAPLAIRAYQRSIAS
ncbi:MAG TPA: hypothetical protein VLA98_14195 [Solirubrobacteraceae bacterium]|nr:hypothetical protein [Solirubrobacteraceae bacterium]